MKAVIESDGSYISLKGYKEHFTLYWSDLIQYKDICNSAEELYNRIDDYLLDVLPDEGYPDWTWANSDLKKACKEVFKKFKK